MLRVCLDVFKPAYSEGSVAGAVPNLSISIQARFGAQHRPSAGPLVADRFLHQKLAGLGTGRTDKSGQPSLYTGFKAPRYTRGNKRIR